ncbi:MAG: DNA repair protein RecO [Phycisphaerae bacterium]|nr:DNA repair protein RecO [Gemmatimonadaceae bacterium]
MSLLATDAIVLHAFSYLETSRILRLLTRDAGVQSVLARGARNSRKRFGSGLDLFAEGTAELQLKPGRDLHTLTSFDVTRSRPGLGGDLSRFATAAAVAECVGRVVHDEAAPGVFDVVISGLDGIAAAPSDLAEPQAAISAGLRALWMLVAAVGFAPAIDDCANCHVRLSPDEDAFFSHVAGGVLCTRCASTAPGGRRLPAAARRTLRFWLEGHTVALTGQPEARSHQRLFREFLAQHLPDNRRATAYGAWESGQLSG